jgi:hypothetical protein
VLKGRAARTRRASKQGQCRDDGIRGDDGIICNLYAVLDDCEFPLQTWGMCEKRGQNGQAATVPYNDAVLSDLNMVADSCRFDDGVSANVNEVADLHRIVVKCTTVGLIRWSGRHVEVVNRVVRILTPAGTHRITQPSPTRQ